MAAAPAHRPALSNAFVAAHATPEGSIDLAAIEREALEKALLTTGWNVTRAARLLGVTRDTLRYRIDKHGIRNNSVH